MERSEKNCSRDKIGEGDDAVYEMRDEGEVVVAVAQD